MSKFKIGYRGKYISPKHGYATITKILNNVNKSVTYDFGGEECPHCGKKIKKERTFKIDKVLVLEYDDGTIGYKGLEKGKDESLIRMPENDFQPSLKKEFDDRVKEIEDGN